MALPVLFVKIGSAIGKSIKTLAGFTAKATSKIIKSGAIQDAGKAVLKFAKKHPIAYQMISGVVWDQIDDKLIDKIFQADPQAKSDLQNLSNDLDNIGNTDIDILLTTTAEDKKNTKNPLGQLHNMPKHWFPEGKKQSAWDWKNNPRLENQAFDRMSVKSFSVLMDFKMSDDTKTSLYNAYKAFYARMQAPGEAVVYPLNKDQVAEDFETIFNLSWTAYAYLIKGVFMNNASQVTINNTASWAKGLTGVPHDYNVLDNLAASDVEVGLLTYGTLPYFDPASGDRFLSGSVLPWNGDVIQHNLLKAQYDRAMKPAANTLNNTDELYPEDGTVRDAMMGVYKSTPSNADYFKLKQKVCEGVYLSKSAAAMIEYIFGSLHYEEGDSELYEAFSFFPRAMYINGSSAVPQRFNNAIVRNSSDLGIKDYATKWTDVVTNHMNALERVMLRDKAYKNILYLLNIGSKRSEPNGGTPDSIDRKNLLWRDQGGKFLRVNIYGDDLRWAMLNADYELVLPAVDTSNRGRSLPQNAEYKAIYKVTSSLKASNRMYFGKNPKVLSTNIAHLYQEGLKEQIQIPAGELASALKFSGCATLRLLNSVSRTQDYTSGALMIMPPAVPTVELQEDGNNYNIVKQTALVWSQDLLKKLDAKYFIQNTGNLSYMLPSRWMEGATAYLTSKPGVPGDWDENDWVPYNKVAPTMIMNAPWMDIQSEGIKTIQEMQYASLFFGLAPLSQLADTLSKIEIYNVLQN